MNCFRVNPKPHISLLGRFRTEAYEEHLVVRESCKIDMCLLTW